MVKQISKNENILFKRMRLFKVQLSLGGTHLLLEQVWERLLEGWCLIYIFKASVFKKTLANSVFNFSHFTLPIIMSVFKLNFMNLFCEIINKIWKWPCPKPCAVTELLSVRYVFFYIFTNSFLFSFLLEMKSLCIFQYLLLNM